MHSGRTSRRFFGSALLAFSLVVAGIGLGGAAAASEAPALAPLLSVPTMSASHLGSAGFWHDDDDDAAGLGETGALAEPSGSLEPNRIPLGSDDVMTGNLWVLSDGSVWVVNAETEVEVDPEVLAEAEVGDLVKLDLTIPSEPLLIEVVANAAEISGSFQPYAARASEVRLVLMTPPGYQIHESDWVTARATLNTTRGFWDEQSNGTVDFQVRLEASLPGGMRSCDDAWETWRRAAQVADWLPWPAEDNTFPQKPYTHMVVVVPRGCERGSYWGSGVGSVGEGIYDGGVVIVFTGADKVDIVTHELGHNMSLQHASVLSCPGRSPNERVNQPIPSHCQVHEYWDHLDVMGFAGVGGPGWLSAPAAARLGFYRETAAVSPASSSTHNLNAVGTNSGLRALRITDPASGEVYWIELRLPIGRDANLETRAQATGNHRASIDFGVRVLKEISNQVPAGYHQLHGATALILHETCALSAQGFRCGYLTAGGEFVSGPTGFRLTVNSIGSSSASVTIAPAQGGGPVVPPTCASGQAAYDAHFGAGAYQRDCAAAPPIPTCADGQAKYDAHFGSGAYQRDCVVNDGSIGVSFDTATGKLRLGLNGVEIPSSSQYGSWSYNSATRTLVFDNFNWAINPDVESTALYLQGSGNLTVQFSGISTFQGYNAILVASGLNVDFTGTGSVTANSNANQIAIGLFENAGLTIKSGTVRATGLAGIYTFGAFAMEGGSLTATSATVYGIYAEPSGSVVFRGGTLVADGGINRISVTASNYTWQAGASSSAPTNTYPPSSFTLPDGNRYVRIQAGGGSSGTAFIDVPSTSPFAADITWMVGKGITTGWQDGTFRPANSITREAMAAFLYRAAGSPAYYPAASPSFRDVPSNSTFYKEVEWLAANGISAGWTVGGNREFRPSNPITREAMASFLYVFAGSPAFTPPSRPTFVDVPSSSQFFKQIEWMVAKGITNGWDDGTFRPGNNITREATAAFLHRASNIGGGYWN